MFKKIFSIFYKILFFLRNICHLENILLNQGKILSNLNHNKSFTTLSDYEFKIFSQWGEDGIIDFLKYNRRAMINIVNTYLKTLPLGDRIVLDESTLNTFIVDTTNEDRDEFIKQICMIFQSNPQLLEKFKQ